MSGKAFVMTNRSQPEIREMLYEDLDDVKAVIKEVFVEWDIKSAIRSIEFHFYMGKVNLWDGRKYYVLTLENEIVGFGGYGLFNPSLYYISWFGIKKEHQNKGFGKYFLIYLLNKIKEEGGKEVIVEAGTHEHYAKANRLYESLGFEKKFSIKCFWNEGDDLVVY